MDSTCDCGILVSLVSKQVCLRRAHSTEIIASELLAASSSGFALGCYTQDFAVSQHDDCLVRPIATAHVRIARGRCKPRLYACSACGYSHACYASIHAWLGSSKPIKHLDSFGVSTTLFGSLQQAPTAFSWAKTCLYSHRKTCC